jgi:hypothetical protein
MTELVNPEEIEEIVGKQRSDLVHWAKAVSEEKKVYLLHPTKCLKDESDLRNCPYSRALDNGIDIREWIEDVPLEVEVGDGHLRPASIG